MNNWNTTEMGNSKLILHCGGKNVCRAELLDIPTPERTNSWVPVAHAKLVDEVAETLERTGLTVTSEAYGLNRNGNQFFGLLGLGGDCLNGSDDYQVVAGIRNSHDKSFPVGLVVGARVFVCDNLSFSSEIQVVRKHTSRLTDDLPRLVATAVGQIACSAERQQARFDHYKATELTEIQAHDLLIQSIDVGATSGRLIPKILDEWRDPSHDEFKEAGNSAWRLLNAFTEAFKDYKVERLPRRTIALQGLLDVYTQFSLAT